MYFEFLIGEGVNSARDDSHLVFIEAQVLDAIGVVHDVLGFLRQVGQTEMFVL